MSIASQLSTLLLPSKCVVCQRLPEPICAECWTGIPIRLRPVLKNNLHGFAITDYSAATADLLNAFKERGQRKLGERLASEVVRLLDRPEADLLLAAPSSAKNFAARGFTPAGVIARTLSRAWRIPVETLGLSAGRGDQSELDRSHRLSNLVGTMSARRPLAGKRLILVDDIVTTGATLTEMARAATQAGALVLGFITVAETIPKSHTKI